MKIFIKYVENKQEVKEKGNKSIFMELKDIQNIKNVKMCMIDKNKLRKIKIKEIIG